MTHSPALMRTMSTVFVGLVALAALAFAFAPSASLFAG